jgi:hypothetical protein
MSNNVMVLGHIAEGPNRGQRFTVPRGHTVFTGMSHISGKTTAEEAIFSRLPETTPPYKVLVFLTKRGEKTFKNSHNIKPYFKSRFDWEYLEGLLTAAMHEKLKFERAWIIKLAKITQQEVAMRHADESAGLFIAREVLGRMLNDKKLRDFDRNIYTVLAAYMDKVLPTLRTAMLDWSQELQLEPGVNVMDLTPWYGNEEVQMLVIRSCMEEILAHENKVIICLPEAWKMLPEGRNTPVKLYFEKFIREGATNENYCYLDAQDLGGLWKNPLRQVSVWVMGRMQEANEVKRLLEQMLGVKVDASDIQTLPLGHFLVATGDKVTRVYVWPNGVPEELSIEVAKGQRQPEDVKMFLKAHQPTPQPTGEELQQQWTDQVKKAYDVPPDHEPSPLVELIVDKNKEIEATAEELSTDLKWRMEVTDSIAFLTTKVQVLELIIKQHSEILSTPITFPGKTQEEVNALKDEIALTKVNRRVTVTPAEKQFQLTTDTINGRVMWLAKDGYLNAWRSLAEIEIELSQKHGWTIPRINLGNALKVLVEQGYLGTRETDRKQYRLGEFTEVK